MSNEVKELINNISKYVYEELIKLNNDRLNKLSESIKEEREVGKKEQLISEKKQVLVDFILQVTDYIKSHLTEQQMKDVFSTILKWDDELDKSYDKRKYRSYAIENDTLYYVLHGLSAAITDKDFITSASEDYIKRVFNDHSDAMIDSDHFSFTRLNFYKTLLLLSYCQDTTLKFNYASKYLSLGEKDKGFATQFASSEVFNDTIMLDAVRNYFENHREGYDSWNFLITLTNNEAIPLSIKTKLTNMFKEIFPEQYVDIAEDVLPSLINDYDSAIKNILDNNLQGMSLYKFLHRYNIKSEDWIKLFNDERLIDRLPDNYLSVNFNTDGETRYNILFHTLLTKFAIEKDLMHQAILGLDDALIYSLLSHTDSLDYILQDQEFRNEFIIKCFSVGQRKPITNAKILELFKDILTPQQMSSLFLPNCMPYDVQLQYYLDDKYCYKIFNIYHPEYNPNGDRDKISDIKKAQILIQRLYNDNNYLFRTFNPQIISDDIFGFDYKFISLISKYKKIQESISGKLEVDEDISRVGVLPNGINTPEKYERYLRLYGYDKDYIVKSKPIDGRICGKIFMNMLRTIDSIDPESVVQYVYDLNNIVVLNHHSYNALNEISLSDEATLIEKFIVNACQGLDISTITPNQWKTLTKIFLHDINTSSQNYYISVDINSLQDVDTYDERRRQKLDNLFIQAFKSRDIQQAINIFLNKYYDIDISTARQIIDAYGSDIDSIKEDKYQKSIDFIRRLNNILNIKNFQELQNLYQNETELSFEDTMIIKNSFTKIFGHSLSNALTTFSDMQASDNSQLNFPPSVRVYEAQDDFILLVHSTDAYGQLKLIGNNYKRSWNESDRTENHGICCSIIANDYLGTAAIKDVLLGFNDISDLSLVKSAPYDLYTSNDGINIKAGKKVKFLSPRNIINNTRHAHNEQSIERRELRNDLINQGIINLQPSYVVVFSDMDDELRQKAIKCAEDFDIPIVYVDRQKVVQNEVRKLDAMIGQCRAIKDISSKIDLFSEIYLKHENNRCGLVYCDDTLKNAFNTSKVEVLLNEIINQMIEEKNKTHDYKKYGDNVLKLVAVLKREDDKFITSYEAGDRLAINDIVVDTYIAKMYGEMEVQLQSNTVSKLSTIATTIPLDDSLLSQELHSMDISTVESEIRKFNMRMDDDTLGHIERTTVLAIMLGKKEIPNDEHAQYLLRLSTELRNNYRWGDYKYIELDLKDKLNSGKVSQDDLHIIQFVFAYQRLIISPYGPDDELKALFQKYGIDTEHMECAQKIAQCLKDAEELDKVRFHEMKKTLNEQYLVTDSSHELISVAQELLQEYQNYAQNQFIKKVEEKCREREEQRELFRQSELKYKMKSGFERIVSHLKDLVNRRRVGSNNPTEGDANEIHRR